MFASFQSRMLFPIALGLAALSASCFPGGIAVEGGFVDHAGWVPEATLTNNAPYQIVCPDPDEVQRRQKLKEEGLPIPGEPPVRYVSPSQYDGGCEQTASSSVYYLFHLFPATPPMDAHYALGLAVQKLEGDKEKIAFARVDGDAVENLIKKEEATVSKLSDDEKNVLKPLIEAVVPSDKYTIQMEAMDSGSLPFVITQPEFMRRMKEMQQTGGGMMGGFPEMFTLLVNTNHELVGQILNTKTTKKRERLIQQSLDLARLSQNLLKGEALTTFIKRSVDLIK